MRACAASDASAVIALCYREYAAPDDPVDNAFLGALLRWGWRARLARPARHCVLGAFDGGGELVGLVELSLRPDDTLAPPVPPPAFVEALARAGGAARGGGSESPYVSNLLVARARRRRGIARALMDLSLIHI